jgi:S1-C subfamily serine protease
VAEEFRDVLSQFSTAVAERAAAACPLVAGIRVRGHSLRSGTLWRKDVVVASEQALPRMEEAEIVLGDGKTFPARLAGRDPGTNVAVLRLDGSAQQRRGRRKCGPVGSCPYGRTGLAQPRRRAD